MIKLNHCDSDCGTQSCDNHTDGVIVFQFVIYYVSNCKFNKPVMLILIVIVIVYFQSNFKSAMSNEQVWLNLNL